jgi:cytochrome c-type biogenesis protein CcmH/NrfG
MEAYQKAVALDPGNVDLRTELARIQIYSSTLLTIDEDKVQRLNDAIATSMMPLRSNRKTATHMPSKPSRWTGFPIPIS